MNNGKNSTDVAITWVKKGSLAPVSKLTQLCLSFSNSDFVEAYNRAIAVINERQIDFEKEFIRKYGGDRSLYEWYRTKYINELLVPINESIRRKEIQLKAILLGGAMCYMVGEVDGKYQCYWIPVDGNK